MSLFGLGDVELEEAAMDESEDEKMSRACPSEHYAISVVTHHSLLNR